MVERSRDIFRLYWDYGSGRDDDFAHRQRDRSMGDILVLSVCGCIGCFDSSVR